MHNEPGIIYCREARADCMPRFLIEYEENLSIISGSLDTNK